MRKEESRLWQYNSGGGFLCEKPHICLDAVYQYDDEDHTELRRSIVITKEEINCYNIWDYFFTKETLLSEIQTIGFNEFEFYGDIVGKEFSDTGETICGVFTK